MDYGRKSWRIDRREDRTNKRDKSRPKLALAGGIVLGIGVLLVFYGSNIQSLNLMMGGGFGVMIGTIMMLFSLKKKHQRGFVKGVNIARNMFKDDCQCCKCTNCGENHNHWTHD